MTLYIVEGNPWPVEQHVDILINKDRKSNDCGAIESAALELTVPEGQLIIAYKLSGHHTLRESDPLTGEYYIRVDLEQERIPSIITMDKSYFR